MPRFQNPVVLVLLAAALWAQHKPPSASHSRASARAALPDPGVLKDGVYRNSAFGFSYKVPFGWVDRTADMQDASAEATSRLLLATFERPPEATGDTINAAVVIAVEPVPAGTKTALEYFDSLSALTTAKGFQEEGPLRELSVGSTRLVRGDFSKPRGTLTMRQVSLVKLEKGFAISFTFIGGSEDELNERIESLNFGSRKPAH